MITWLLITLIMLYVVLSTIGWHMTRWNGVDEDVRNSARFTLLSLPLLLLALAVIAYVTDKQEWSLQFALVCFIWLAPIPYLSAAVNKALTISAARRRARNAVGVAGLIVFVLQMMVSGLISGNTEGIDGYNTSYLYDALLYCLGGVGLATVVATASYHIPFTYLREHRQAK